MAERQGFEPWRGVTPYTLSRRAPSANSDTSPIMTYLTGLENQARQRKGNLLKITGKSRRNKPSADKLLGGIEESPDRHLDRNHR